MYSCSEQILEKWLLNWLVDICFKEKSEENNIKREQKYHMVLIIQQYIVVIKSLLALSKQNQNIWSNT